MKLLIILLFCTFSLTAQPNIDSALTLMQSPDVHGRVNGIALMLELSKEKRPECIEATLGLIPNNINNWAVVISVSKYFYQLGRWTGTLGQMDKFQLLKHSKYYWDKKRNIKLYVDNSLNSFYLK